MKVRKMIFKNLRGELIEKQSVEGIHVDFTGDCYDHMA